MRWRGRERDDWRPVDLWLDDAPRFRGSTITSSPDSASVCFVFVRIVRRRSREAKAQEEDQFWLLRRRQEHKNNESFKLAVDDVVCGPFKAAACTLGKSRAPPPLLRLIADEDQRYRQRDNDRKPECCPACHKLPISRFLIKWQIFWGKITEANRRKLKFYSNAGSIRALKWTKSQPSSIGRKRNYSNSCFCFSFISLHMRLFVPLNACHYSLLLQSCY